MRSRRHARNLPAHSGALLAAALIAWRLRPPLHTPSSTNGFTMDNATTSSTADPTTTSPVTPFPASGDTGGNARPASSQAAEPSKPAEAMATAEPIVDRLIKRAASSAHDAIDDLAAKATSLADGLKDGAAKAGNTRDEWIASARDAIRQHPFATVAGALLVGAALLSLSSARRN